MKHLIVIDDIGYEPVSAKSTGDCDQCVAHDPDKPNEATELCERITSAREGLGCFSGKGDDLIWVKAAKKIRSVEPATVKARNIEVW